MARNCKSTSGEISRDYNAKPRIRAATARTYPSSCDFIVDSGASQHIANELSVFTTIEIIPGVSVHLADDTVVEAEKQGTVLIDLKGLKPSD